MIEYKVVFSRRRTLLITLNPRDGVIVRAPLRTSLKSIDRFVQSKSLWIIKHLDRFSTVRRLDTKVEEGLPVLFRGKEYRAAIRVSDRNYVSLNEKEIMIYVTSPADNDKAGALVKRWYRENALEIFREKLEEILVRFVSFGFKPYGLTVRAMKSRWGSCSSKGMLSLNSELIKLDDRFTEYIILHELCHLRHANHGAAFYRLLTEVCPQWKNIRKELGKYHS